MSEKPFGIVRRGWDHNPQAGNVTEDGVVTSRVMGGGRVSDSDASSQQDRHLQAAAAHVLHFCDLIDDFAESVIDEVNEHEVDDGPGSRHRSAAAHADESALCNRRVAEPLRAILGEQAGSGARSFHLAFRFPRQRRRCGGWQPSRCPALRAWPQHTRVRGRSLGQARERAERSSRHRRESVALLASGQGAPSAASLARATSSRISASIASSSASVAWPDSTKTPRNRLIGTTFAPFGDFLSRPVGIVAHSFRMRPRAVRPAFDQRRPLPCARPVNCVAGGLTYRFDVVAIDFHSRHVVGSAAAGYVRICRCVGERHFSRELVVLAHEEHRELPDTREIQSFMEGSVVHRAIAEEGDRNTIGPQQFETVACSGCLEDTWTNDATGTHQPDFRSKQVHGSAAAAGASGLTAEQFGDEFADGQSFRERVAVAPVRAEDGIIVTKVRTHAGGDCFLADVGVARTMNQPARVASRELLLRRADQLHGAVEISGVRAH